MPKNVSHRVLVTGASGFVGRALASRLEKAGHIVHQFLRSRGCDLLRPESFLPFVDASIDTVIHCAGLTFVPESWRNPAEFYAVNTLGTQHVLDFCRTVHARHIYISAYVYGIPRYLPIDEQHPVSPNNPYAHSKWLAEELSRFYATEMGVGTIIMRPFNLYGPGQNGNFLIPSIVKQACCGGEIVVKDTAPRRDYLHISDFVDACLLALNCRDMPFRIFNVGAGYSLSVLEIVETIARTAGNGIRWHSTGDVRNNEIPDTVADCTMIRNVLGWSPRLSFQDGVDALVHQVHLNNDL